MNRKGTKLMKQKVVSIVLVFALALGIAAMSGCGSSKVVLNVYNWGMNIAEGEDGYIDVIALFEEKYPDIEVNYTTYETNEALYTRLKNGGNVDRRRDSALAGGSVRRQGEPGGRDAVRRRDKRHGLGRRHKHRRGRPPDR